MVQLLAAQFGGLWLWAVVVAAAAVVLWRRGCRLRGRGLFAAGLLLASAGYVALIDKAAPLFVYCLSGARSRMAVAQLQQMGYAKVTNLGGINSYRGKVER